MSIKKGFAAALFLFLLPALRGQDSTAPAPRAEASADAPATPPPTPERKASRDIFPNLNLYLPEGEVNLRARKLIRNVLFESQINYKVVHGSISTFLRYKYYARDFTYKIGVFDTIDFDSPQSGSRNFDRVRGGLLLFEYPTNYNQRYFFLTQLDGLSFGDVDRSDNNKNNLYFKLGYQQGTPFDERLNSIVGESRGRITPVLTAFRDIGPQKLGFAFAATHGLDAGKLGGTYDYTKLETEALKRTDFTENTFLISRLHMGTILQKKRRLDANGEPVPIEGPLSDAYVVPRYELFTIGGRDALKGIGSKHRGTDEAHMSNELFLPVFRNRDYRFLGAQWNSFYAIGYAGIGGCRCDDGVANSDSREISRLNDFVVDAGLGFESALSVRDYDIFLSVLVADTVKAPSNLKGHEIRFSVRTSR